MQSCMILDDFLPGFEPPAIRVLLGATLRESPAEAGGGLRPL